MQIYIYGRGVCVCVCVCVCVLPLCTGLFVIQADTYVFVCHIHIGKSMCCVCPFVVYICVICMWFCMCMCVVCVYVCTCWAKR